MGCAGAGLVRCDVVLSDYPEVVVVHALGERELVQQISYNGCLWPSVLAPGKATSPQRCVPGTGRVAFKRLDVGNYCRKQIEQCAFGDVCPCQQPDPSDTDSPSWSKPNPKPLWFNYRTITTFHADYGDYLRVELVPEDLEQDYTIPGPYGH